MLPIFQRSCVLLDLDGTVIDSQEGIFNGLAYMYEKSGMVCPSKTELRRFIGPAIGTILRELYAFPPEQIDRMVVLYREYYGQKGLLECCLYSGMADLIKRLKEQGKKVAIATKKPEPFARRIMENLGAAPLLDGVFGADPSDKSDHKDHIILTAMETLGIEDKKQVIMVGDTRFDCIGANLAGVDCLGVEYGFGSREELLSHGAIALARDMDELTRLLCGNAV